VPLLSVDLASLMAIFRSNDLSKAVQVEDWAILIKEAGKALLDPRLASLSAGGLLDEATISTPDRERQQQQQQVDDTDSNEDDDSDDDDSMDIDHDGDQPMSAAEAETDALADAFRDAKIARVFTILPQASPLTDE
jgi:hypothetical protein